MLDDIKYYIQDNGKKVFMIFVIIALVVLMFVLQNQNKKESLDGQLTADEITVTAKELQKHFSILSLQNVAFKEGQYALDIDLFLKSPHLTYADMDIYLNQYLEILKKQYNNEEKNIFIQAVKINIYDRLLIYEKELDPRGKFEYKYTLEKVAENLGEDFEELEGIDYQREEALNNEKYPDYEKEYEAMLTYTEYEDDTITPLSTQELEFLLKLEVYRAFKGATQNYLSAYFEWEYGVLLKDDQYLRETLTQVFEDFQLRNKNTGGEVIYYDTELEKASLEKDLAINNPRFLYFLLESKHVEDKIEAKKGLIEHDKEKYLQIFIEDAIQKVQENSDDLSSVQALEELNVSSDVWTNGKDIDMEDIDVEDLYENPKSESTETESTETESTNTENAETESTETENAETESTETESTETESTNTENKSNEDLDAEINKMINNQ